MGSFLNTNTSKRVLLTGGRAPVTLDLVRYFAAEGYLVYVADSFTYHLSKSSNKVEKSFTISSPVHSYEQFITDLHEIIKTYQIDLLVPTCEEIFYIAKGKKTLEKDCIVFCEELSILNEFHHKYKFIQKVQAKGLPIPETYVVHSQDEYKKALHLIQCDAVVKPVYSRFGTEVVFVKKDHIEDINSQFREGVYVVQEEIKGKTICNYSILHHGKLMATANYEVHYTAGKGAAIQFQHTPHLKIKQWLEQFFKNSNVTGQFAFDFIETKSGDIFVIECNPRSTSGLHLFKDVNIVESFLGINEQTLEPLPQTKRMIGLAMLIYGMKPGTFLKGVQTYITSADIIWSKRDMKPFFYQFYTYFHMLRLGRKLKISALEASTVDIEWNGDHL